MATTKASKKSADTKATAKKPAATKAAAAPKADHSPHRNRLT